MTGPELFSIIGSVVGVGLALAVLILRVTARIDADRRAADAKFDADRRAVDAKFDADRKAVDARIDADRKAADARFDADRKAADERAAQDRAEAAADRRALQVAMDDFRKEMQRLAGRQSRLEGAAGD